MKNPYQVLHLSEDANFEEIKARYKHLTKLIHPDKQPHNRQLAKKHFEDIERAYKSIASPLRMYVFSQFGTAGINLLDEYPIEFLQFDQSELNHRSKMELRQKIIYILYQHHAQIEGDKTKFSTKTVLNTNTSFRQFDRSIPEIQKCDFEVQMPLPKLFDFTNTLQISHRTSSIPRSAKSEMYFNFRSMKRIRQSLALSTNVSLSQNEYSCDISFEKNINPSFLIRFTPITATTSGEEINFGFPRIGFEKAFQNVNFSGVTDFQHVNFQIGDSTKKKINKNIKIVIENNAFALIPKVEAQITNYAKIFAQLMVSGQRGESFDFRFGFLYGIRIKMGDQLRMEVTSNLGYHNFLQVTLFTPKFKVVLPIINDVSTDAQKQAIKLGFMVVVLSILSMHKYKQLRNKKMKANIMKVAFNRLTDQKSALIRLNNDNDFLATQTKQREIKFKGLVIFKAFIGSPQKVSQVRKFILQQRKKWKHDDLSIQLQKISQQEFKCGQIQDELYDLTKHVQSKVFGSSLLNFKCSQMNPCIFEQQKSKTLIYYWLRGQQKIITFSSNQTISIGRVSEKDSQIIYLFKKLLRQIF